MSQDETNEIMRSLGRLESKVDALMLLDGRVGALEKAWAKVTGIALVASLAGTYILQKLTGKTL